MMINKVGNLKTIKRDMYKLILLENIYILNKCWSFFAFNSSNNQIKKYHMFQKILSSTTISSVIINHHIIMISEGSCEDWSSV